VRPLDELARDCWRAEADHVAADAGATMSSIVENVPPHTNRLFDRVDLDVGLLGVLAPPCGGTFATVPSRILSSACCTPSPDTSRVIETLLVVRAILSISSM
jgi:hypothetical protein